MRIGLFGGTFNPVHLGHLRAALEVEETFHLDRVVLIPALIPPHKSGSYQHGNDIAAAEDRIHMLRLAVEGHLAFDVSDIEFARTGPSYTVDTVHYFCSRMPSDARLFFVLGEDAFFELDTWKSYHELLLSISLIVMARPGSGTGDFADRRNQVGKYLKSAVSSGYSHSTVHDRFVHSSLQPIYFVSFPALDISATRIRKLARQGRSIQYLVPDKVERHIKKKGLYL